MIRRAVLLSSGLAALCVPARASCDPIALRAPFEGRTAVAAGGAPECSVAFWLDRRFGVAVEWRLPASAVGADIGTRWTLLGDTLGWGVDLNASVGLTVPLIVPGVGVNITPSVVGRWRDEHFLVATSVAIPSIAQVLPSPDLRLPVMFELWLGGHYGRFRGALHGGVGSTWMPGLSWSGAFQATALVGVDL